MAFFTNVELSKVAKVKVDKDQLESDCLSCGLYKNKDCYHPRLEIDGQGKKKIMIIGEFPSFEEDEYGSLYTGDTGEILKQELKKYNINLQRDCWRVSTVRCAIGFGRKNAIPTDKEIKYCFPYIEKQIHKLKPELIIAAGPLAITGLFGDSFSKREVKRWAKSCIHDEKFKTKIVPIHSPWFISTKNHDSLVAAYYAREIKFAINQLKREYRPREDFESKVKILTTFDSVTRLLKQIIRKKTKIAFDYETTGLKPFRKGHKIVTIGIAVSEQKAFAFPYNYKTFWTENEFSVIKSLWAKIMSDHKIKKIAHNIGFEIIWTDHLVAQMKCKHWDTMLSQHVQDHRTGTTSLKFQAFLRYGVRPYDKHIKPFLTAKNGEFNTVEQAPFKDLLLYNGLDCIFTFMLYNDQLDFFSKMRKMGRANNFFFKGMNTLVGIQQNGIHTSTRYYKWAGKFLTKKIDKAEKYLAKGREARKFKEKMGREISLTSGKDLGILFYEVLGKEAKYTNEKKENYKTDKATLKELNLPFVDHLIGKKEYEKALGTYLGQFRREIVRGKMYPFFSLHIPVSYRSSSSRPNFQNLPKRNKEIKNLVRKGIVPSPGCVICEADFSGAEVITSACVTRDTKIETIEGSKTIGQIIERIKTHSVFVYGYCLKEKRIKISEVTDGGLTGHRQEVWKVTLDNGESIKATPEHNFMTRHGSKHEGKYVELQNLKPGMSLMPFYKKEKNGYCYVNLNNRKTLAEHTMIGRDVFGWDVGDSYDSDVVHHRDENGLNNKFKNLEVMSRKAHTSLHHKGKVTGPHSKEHRAKISKALKGIPCPQRAVKWTEEQRQNLSEAMKGRIFSKSTRKKISEHKKAYWKNKEYEICRICGGKFKTITNTHLRHMHGISLEEYKEEFNHKVVSVEFYGYKNVYNINVKDIHNFATSAGVIIKNSYHKDKQFIHDITIGDMHRDLATELFMFPDDMLKNDSYTKEQKALAKMLRFFAKNNWTFAQFYGDWFKSCGDELWKNVVDGELCLPIDGITVKEWLEDKGIFELGDVIDGNTTRGSFLEHCKHVEQRMWQERFPDYTQWKEDICEQYKRLGYIETFLGFRFNGLMDRKQCTNYPIQGCLQGHSKVLTSKGWRRIDSLVNRNVKVWTGFEWKNAIGVDRGKCQTATVHLESGLQLDCDTRHEFKNEENEWVKFSELKEGDYVALPKVMPRLELPAIEDIKIDWFFVMGFATGDGWFGSRKITDNNIRYVLQISGGETKYALMEKINKFFHKYCQKGFPKSYIRFASGKNERMKILHAEGRKLAELLMSFGYECDKNAHTKSIPLSVWNETKKNQQSFINGLWLSDGSRKRKSLHMCNLDLLKEVQIMLYGLGYDSFIKKTGNGWKLTPQNILHKTYTSRYFPRKTLDMLRRGKTVAYDKNDNTTITDRRNIVSNKDVTQIVAERILNKLNPDCELYRYDRVKKIEVLDSIENTYTMSVDDNLHQFVADGIICKNTSFHLLLHTLIQVQRFIIDNKMETKLIGQIHDSVISDTPKDELTFYLRGVNKIVKGLKDEFDWIIVPMEIEAEITKVKEDGGNFSEFREVDAQNPVIWTS